MKKYSDYSLSKHIPQQLYQLKVEQEDFERESLPEEKAGMIGFQLFNTQIGISPEEFALSLEIKDVIERMLGGLTMKESRVIELRYGLLDGVALSLRELGGCMGFAPEGIRRIEMRAFRKLRKRLAREGFLENPVRSPSFNIVHFNGKQATFNINYGLMRPHCKLFPRTKS